MDLSRIDTASLTEREQIMLAPFYLAYKPHSPIPSRAVLKIEGEGTYFPSQNEKTMDLIKEQAKRLDSLYYDFLATVTRDEQGNITDLPE